MNLRSITYDVLEFCTRNLKFKTINYKLIYNYSNLKKMKWNEIKNKQKFSERNAILNLVTKVLTMITKMFWRLFDVFIEDVSRDVSRDASLNLKVLSLNHSKSDVLNIIFNWRGFQSIEILWIEKCLFELSEDV